MSGALREPDNTVNILARTLPDALAILSAIGIENPEVEYALPREGALTDGPDADWRVVRADRQGRRLVVTRYPSAGAKTV